MQYGMKALQVLSLRGGNATQAELAAEVGLGQDRLSPVLAGLQHNGYVTRSFAPDLITVTLTEEGQRWLAKTSSAAAPPPQRPAPQQQQQRPQPQPAPQASDLRRRLGLGLGKAAAAPTQVAPPPAAAPVEPPAPAPTPVASPEPPAPAPVPVVAPESPAASVEEPPQTEVRRPRRRKGEPKEEIATDESGFVTHIKGKAIF